MSANMPEGFCSAKLTGLLRVSQWLPGGQATTANHDPVLLAVCCTSCAGAK